MYSVSNRAKNRRLGSFSHPSPQMPHPRPPKRDTGRSWGLRVVLWAEAIIAEGLYRSTIICLYLSGAALLRLRRFDLDYL